MARPHALVDFTYESFAQGEIARLNELRLLALEDRVEADLALGRHAELVAELEVLIAENPLRERPRAQLMLALYRSGRQAEALEAYQDARRALVDELGIEPSHELKDLEQLILTQDARIAAPGPPRGRSTPEGEKLRVVLADDNYLVREGVKRILATDAGIDVVAACGDLDSLLEAIELERPDVVLTDIRMPPGQLDEGIQAAERLRETSPKTGVVVLSQYAEPRYAIALLERGSAGRAYLLKERVHDLEQLASAIRDVAAGGSVIDPKIVDLLIAARSRAETSPLDALTPREREVLAEMAQGKNNAAIAASLVITERSVEKVIHSIFTKLGLSWEKEIHRRVKAVLLFLSEQGG